MGPSPGIGAPALSDSRRRPAGAYRGGSLRRPPPFAPPPGARRGAPPGAARGPGVFSHAAYPTAAATRSIMAFVHCGRLPTHASRTGTAALGPADQTCSAMEATAAARDQHRRRMTDRRGLLGQPLCRRPRPEAGSARGGGSPRTGGPGPGAQRRRRQPVRPKPLTIPPRSACRAHGAGIRCPSRRRRGRSARGGRRPVRRARVPASHRR